MELGIISSNFGIDNGFKPFSKNATDSDTVHIRDYLGERSLLGNYAVLAVEEYINNIAGITNVKINTAYALRGSVNDVQSVLTIIMDQIFPIFTVLVYLLPIMYLIQRVVEEKQTKTRESMRMMGMKDSAYWASWFVVFFIQNFTTSLIMTLGTAWTIFTSSNIFLVFCIYFLYGISNFGFCILMTALFDTVRTVSIGGLILNLISYYISYAFPKNMAMGWRLLSGVVPNLNLFHGNHPIWQVHSFKSISFSTINDIEKSYSITIFFGMAIVSMIVWTLIGLYVSYIIPTEFGTRKHPCFCFMRKRRTSRRQGSETLLSHDESESDDPAKSQNFEKVGNDLKELEGKEECLNIRNLKKVYPNGFHAVNNLSLKMYSGQIFALLGHNGAGKTTTISMLTGLFGSSGGQAEAFGIDLLNDQDEARKIMGVCPQHNVLFPSLTPKEHFDIFCDFKGVPDNKREEAINKCLANVDLDEQKDVLSKNLSGGQKRKVNVGIAMLGDSKIVLLDEPTSGMDPTARRRLWELLKENKKDKIIILTTHYMEEADILGDRIAIMANGNAECCGSPIFLKEKFGVGYYLTIDKTTQDKVPEIDEFVMSRIPGAIKLSEVSSEASFQLPNTEINLFKDFFIEIDENRDSLQIKSYGISATTLEEVFLKVGDGLVEKDDTHGISINDSRSKEKANDEYCLVDESIEGFSLSISQLFAMIKIRVLMTVRELRILFLEVALPTLLIIISAILLGVSINLNDEVAFLTLDRVPDHQVTTFAFNQNNIAASDDVSRFMNTYYAEPPFNGNLIQDQFGGDNLMDTAGLFNLNVMEMEEFTNIFSVYVNDISDDIGVRTYDILTIIDPAQKGAAGYAVQGAMTSILRDATGDNNAEFNIRRGPFPQTKKDDDLIKIVLAIVTIFSYTVAFGVITSSIAGNICKEREDSLKHQQIVSGGSKLSYWLSMFITDLFKFIAP